MRGVVQPRARGPQQIDPVIFAETVVDQGGVVSPFQQGREAALVGRRPVERYRASRRLLEERAGQQIVILIIIDQKHGGDCHGSGNSTTSNQYWPMVFITPTRASNVTGFVTKELAPRS
jgi:hypothetical protein